MDPVIARKLARTANPYPSVVFLAPEAAAAYAAAGLPAGRTGYFAGRAAPMGAVTAEVVIATFYSFQPELIRSCIPAAWSAASPEVILGHRLTSVDAALRRILGDEVVTGPEIKEADRLARAAAEACQPEGRALFAGHASLPWPGEPHLDLWHSLTLLREHRGDGHLIALQVAGYSGCDAMVMTQAMGDAPAAFVASRAWSAEQWADSADGLRARGLIDGDGVATEAGRAHREAVERQTDLLALAPLEALGEAGCLRLRELIRPMSVAIAGHLFPQLPTVVRSTMVEDVLYSVADGVATITLNRPERLNALNGAMYEGLIEAFDQTDRDDEVRAVVVTGAGRAFCAGADLSGGARTFDYGQDAAASEAHRDRGGMLVLRIYRSLKPVIAAINGPAVGVGVTMTLPMDIRIMADSARVAFPFARRGIVPDGASSWFLPRIVGISQALEWCLTGRLLSSEEALAAGLARTVCPVEDVLPLATRLAGEIAASAAPVSAVLTRHLLWQMLGADHPMVTHRIDSQAIYDTGRMADSAEGVAAFLEKREPAWTLAPSKDLPAWFPWRPEPPFAE